MRYLFILVSCFCCCISCAQSDDSGLSPDVRHYTYHLQNTPVNISIHSYLPASRLTFIILHDNEHTAEQATLQILEQYGGNLISIGNDDERVLSFDLSGKKFSFDPNRMFTPAGIKQSLQTHSRYEEKAAEEIEKFAAYFLNNIPESNIPVAIHNNTNKEYSIIDYLGNGKLKKDAEEVYQNPAMDTDDFVFTTVRRVYDFYKGQNMNVVLQNNSAAKDDGSLSVYYGKQNKAYINIEAEHEHEELQVKMMEILFQFLVKF